MLVGAMSEAEPQRKSVLIVEDDPEIRRLLHTVLLRQGYFVMEAPHGEAALQLLAADPLPGVILLDLYLPLMDGWEFRQAQLRDPRLAAVPVVVISAAADVLIEPLDAEQVMKKPLDIPRLLTVVAGFCAPTGG